MRMYDLILKKRNGSSLNKEEIIFMIEGFTKGEIPDYQMSAMMMAIFFNGMDKEETLNLTMAMANSGETLDLSSISGVKVDKHSTGGVGDKTSLILGPMVAAMDVKMAKMSGRGLGHTGGTIDKLESFPGFQVALSKEKFIENVNQVGMAIVGQTANLAPADKKLYALRDVTATVDQMSLIAGSIMSKKLAAGADVIVLDVKTGSGAFMQEVEKSVELAKTMVDIGNGAGKKTTAIISDMDRPLGFEVGNILEVKEVIETLKGNGPSDLFELSLEIAAHMVYGAQKATSIQEAKEKILEKVKSGEVLEKLAEFVKAQGGDPEYVYHPERFPTARITEEVRAVKEGYIHSMNTQEVGMVSLILGGGRETKESIIDLTVGVTLKKKTGDFVEAGQVLAILHGNEESKVKEAKARMEKLYTISKDKVGKVSLIKKIIL